jgi:hypothetical protein
MNKHVRGEWLKTLCQRWVPTDVPEEAAHSLGERRNKAAHHLFLATVACVLARLVKTRGSPHAKRTRQKNEISRYRQLPKSRERSPAGANTPVERRGHGHTCAGLR